MIARRLWLKDPSRSSMVRLVKYLTDTQGVDSRVGEIRITNCASDSPQWAALEMQAVQRQNRRARGDKTYHLVLSFNETPDSATLRQIESHVCKELGFGEHQRLSVMHHDTDHPHLHIAINKIHPRKRTMREPYYDERTLGKACAFLERVHGLKPDNHEERSQATETAATSMEQAGDLESLTGFIRRTCLDGLLQAASWAGVHELLARHGLELRERGNGLVISSGDVHVKASSVDRRISKKRLEERLGAFAPRSAGKAPARGKTYAPRPMGVRHEALWGRYGAWAAENDAARKTALAEVRQERDADMADLRRSSDFKYLLIKNSVSDPALRRFLLRLNRMRLRRKAKKLREACAERRKAVSEAHRHVTWAAWLTRKAAERDAEVLAYLHRRRHKPAAEAALSGARPAEERPAIQKVTRHGTFLYAEGRERQGRVLVAPNADDAALAQSLELARRRYGERMQVDGPPGFAERIARVAGEAGLPVAFTDRRLEAMRQAALNGGQAQASGRGR